MYIKKLTFISVISCYIIICEFDNLISSSEISHSFHSHSYILLFYADEIFIPKNNSK